MYFFWALLLNFKFYYNMKKTILFLAFSLVMGVSTSFAQFNKGDKDVRVGLGLIGFGFNATAEYGIIDDLGVGLYFGYERNSLGYLVASYSYNSLYFGPRGTYHFNRLLKLDTDKFDIYASAGVLIHRYSYPDDYWGVYGNSFKTSYTTAVPLARVGGKYNFSESMSLFADTGSGGSLLQAGLSFKF